MWQSDVLLWRQVSSDYMNEVLIIIDMYFYLLDALAHLADASAER
jgi:hypothetical protein